MQGTLLSLWRAGPPNSWQAPDQPAGVGSEFHDILSLGLHSHSINEKKNADSSFYMQFYLHNNFQLGPARDVKSQLLKKAIFLCYAIFSQPLYMRGLHY